MGIGKLAFWRNRSTVNQQEPAVAPPVQRSVTQIAALDALLAPNDPLLAYFQSAPGPVEVDKLRLDSPALRRLQAEGVVLALPLVSQGELVGLINLGPRRSEQEYTGDDRRLLNDLITQAAPAVRVAQLVRQQQAEARERERMEHELRIARTIQQTLLPRELPSLPGYRVEAHYQPAREVGGDFYDFIHFEDGCIGLVVGDVTDKGVPAALVMATTRTLLRAASERLRSPGLILERVNDLLCNDIPPKMFVTCLYALLDPASGRLRYANAGHDVPYRHNLAGVDELRAAGMPLGLLPGMKYDEREALLLPGDQVLFYSDGLVEAHNAQREMFSFDRLRNLMVVVPPGDDCIGYLLDKLAEFTGPEWEQEDDVTLVTLRRLEEMPAVEAPAPAAAAVQAANGIGVRDNYMPVPQGGVTVADFTVASAPGNERIAMDRVANAVRSLGVEPGRIERLKTAVAEATMNAMEHGNGYRADLYVGLRVTATPGTITVRITDHGGGKPIPAATSPDLEAKLEGLQSPRGWGLFLIRSMVDEMRVAADDRQHTVELVWNR
jgi:serine phosphatase RsbU (regulator of sigma subunit)/anti-sigma regulatory factor (Ser/Thr protein kinase)